jgi:hypothetical protein
VRIAASLVVSPTGWGTTNDVSAIVGFVGSHRWFGEPTISAPNQMQKWVEK